MRSILSAIIVVLGSVATCGAHSLAVPFFADDGGTMAMGLGNGNATFIGIRNVSTAPLYIHITYIMDTGTDSPVFQSPQPYLLGGQQGVSWRPFQDDVSEGIGITVPGVLPGGEPFGSAIISWQGGEFGGKTLSGRVVQLGGSGTFAHAIRN